MKPFSVLRRAVALGLFSISIAGLSGCGGHRSGSSSSPEETVAKAFTNPNLEGTFDAPERAASSTSCTIQFDGTVGSATFKTGTASDGSFRAYSADVLNLDYVYQGFSGTTAHGTTTFDLKNFTANRAFSGTAHFSGTYTVESSGAFAVSGTLTGQGPTGTAASVSLNLAYQALAKKVDLTGTYSGSIVLPTLTGTSSVAYTGATLAGVSNDGVHINATFPVKNPLTGSPTSIAFKGAYTHSALAGSFDASSTLGIGEGLVGQMYLETTDEGKSFTGTYVILNADGTVFPNPLTGSAIVGTITGTKGTTGGGTASALKLGYYDGGGKRNGVLDGRILKLNVVKNSATTGANGAAIIVTNSSAPNVGGRIASIAGSGNDFTMTIDSMSNTYTSMVVTGTVSGTALNATYTAKLVDGTTETGSFDQLGQGSTTTSNLTASWSGNATSAANGNQNAFAATFKSNGDGTVLITPSTTVGGTGTVPAFKIPAFTAYQAGTSFAGHVNGTAGTSPLIATIIGDFDGDVSGKSIAGTYAYGAYFGTNPVLTDAGTLRLTKP